MKNRKNNLLPIVFATLIIATSISFGISSLNRFGFISDDWHSIFYFTHHYYSDIGIKLVDFFRSNDFSPFNIVGQLLNILIYSVARYSKISYSLPNPAIFMLFNMVITVFVGYISFLVVQLLIKSRSLSFFCAILIALYPAKSTSLFWYSSIIANFELLLFLNSLYLLLLSAKKKNNVFFIGSVILFAMSCLCYNFAIFMSPVLAVFAIYYWRKRIYKAISFGSLYLLTSASIIYFKVSIFIGGGKKLVDNHLLTTLESTFNNTYGSNFYSFSKPLFLKGLNIISIDKYLILLLIILIVLFILTIKLFGSQTIKRKNLVILLVLGIMVYGLSTLSLSSSTYLSPLSFGIGNRVNVFPCLGLSIIFTTLLGYIFRDKSYIVKYFIAAYCIYLLIINTGISGSYKDSFDYQINVISFVEDNKSLLSSDSDNHFVLLDNKSDSINGIPTIDSSWGLGYMLDGTLGLKTTKSHSTVISNGLVFAEDNVVNGNTKIPYDGYYVNYDRRIFQRFTNRSELIDMILENRK